jgi:hypothetical protein
MKRCEFRVVTPEEIQALTEHSGEYNGPQKIPFKQTVPMGKAPKEIAPAIAEPEFSPLPTKRRLSKQQVASSEDESSDVDMEKDSEFELSDDKEHRTKKARHSVPFSPKQTLRQQTKKASKG